MLRLHGTGRQREGWTAEHAGWTRVGLNRVTHGQGLWGLDARVQLRATSITVGQGKVQQVELVFAHKRFSRKRELGQRRRVIFGGRAHGAR
jgi:hypothetical protein